VIRLHRPNPTLDSREWGSWVPRLAASGRVRVVSAGEYDETVNETATTWGHAMTVRSFAKGLAPLCAVVFALALAYAAVAQVQAPAARPATPPNRSGLAALPRVTSPRIYVIDCGTLIFNRPEDYNLTRNEVADTNMPVPCFLVIHPKGLLLFDTGLSDRLVGHPVYENVVFGYGQIKFNTLKVSSLISA